MLARIFQPARSAMQSGKGAAKEWLLEFDTATARSIDPLMGWTATSDTSGQVRLSFDTREEAIDYATRAGIPFQVREPREPKRIIKAYADNFTSGRRRPWTH